MLKYVESRVTFAEIPDQITLCINISDCPFRCKGCHSQHLRMDVGNLLDPVALDSLITKNRGITAVCFMGGDAHPEEINELGAYVKSDYPNLAVGWYSGNNTVASPIKITNFDYIKVGPYIETLGGLNSPRTNQRFYMVACGELIDWTYRFWR